MVSTNEACWYLILLKVGLNIIQFSYQEINLDNCKELIENAEYFARFLLASCFYCDFYKNIDYLQRDFDHHSLTGYAYDALKNFENESLVVAKNLLNILVRRVF